MILWLFFDLPQIEIEFEGSTLRWTPPAAVRDAQPCGMASARQSVSSPSKPGGTGKGHGSKAKRQSRPVNISAATKTCAREERTHRNCGVPIGILRVESFRCFSVTFWVMP